ncbi:MAG TPA: hypothetical protein VFX03_06205, partial [Thermomicrobiales bacterium]|nr:hypothetical protein [Thermomicrobiales bacterium]
MVSDPPTVAILMPAKTREQMLTPQAMDELRSFARVRIPSGPTVTAADVAALLDDAVAGITGWGTPPLSLDLLSDRPALRLVAHTAGSIRKLVPVAAMERGLRVSHAAAIIADAV